jgi:hypothetical protein
MQILLSTAYLPPIEYFAGILAAGEISIEAHETYARQTYRNRCYIAGPNGIQYLTVPVIRPAGNHTPVSEVLTDPGTQWQRIHWKALESAYNKSAFFLYYRDDLETLYTKPAGQLLEFNIQLINKFCKFIRIDTPLFYTAAYVHHPIEAIDLRNRICPKKQGLLPVCFLPEYFQPFSPKYGFRPNLSIADLLFALGPACREYLERLVPRVRQTLSELPAE